MLSAHIGGKKARRRQRARLAVRWLLRGALAAGMLSLGFLITETMLRISELPLETTATTVQTTIQTETTIPPRPESPPLKTFYVPLGMMDNREQSRQLMAQIAQAKTDTAVMLFKDSSGYLSYKSNLMQMSLLGASQRTRWRTDWTLYDLKNRSKQRILGVIHCFDDPLAASLMPNGAALLRETDTVPWKDAQGRAWLNPYAESSREYLLAVIREVRAFGADDLLLCGVQFPEGNLEAAVFPGESAAPPERLAVERAGVLRSFLQEAKRAAGEGTLYVMVTPAQDALPGMRETYAAADIVAVDMRGLPWTGDEAYWRARVPVLDSPEAAAALRDCIVMKEENLQARY
jgi:hypothetical protein